MPNKEIEQIAKEYNKFLARKQINSNTEQKYGFSE